MAEPGAQEAGVIVAPQVREIKEEMRGVEGLSPPVVECVRWTNEFTADIVEAERDQEITAAERAELRGDLLGLSEAVLLALPDNEEVATRIDRVRDLEPTSVDIGAFVGLVERMKSGSSNPRLRAFLALPGLPEVMVTLHSNAGVIPGTRGRFVAELSLNERVKYRKEKDPQGGSSLEDVPNEFYAAHRDSLMEVIGQVNHAIETGATDRVQNPPTFS